MKGIKTIRRRNYQNIQITPFLNQWSEDFLCILDLMTGLAGTSAPLTAFECNNQPGGFTEPVSNSAIRIVCERD
jgi:hypothetical protein